MRHFISDLVLIFLNILDSAWAFKTNFLVEIDVIKSAVYLRLIAHIRHLGGGAGLALRLACIFSATTTAGGINGGNEILNRRTA
jgi:hypothetical protein